MFSKRLNILFLLLVAVFFVQCHNHSEATQETAKAVSNVTEKTVAAKEEMLATTAQVQEAGAKLLEEAPTLTAAKEKVAETATSVTEKAKEVATTAKEEVKEKAAEVKKKAKPKPKPKPKKKKRSKIKFGETIHQFGTIKQGEVIKHDFKFTNTGNAPLVIKNVDVSCGCTFPSYPFIPIEPGKEGTIGVTYNSKGKMGPQKPTITVVTNGRPRTLKLNLQGVVE